MGCILLGINTARNRIYDGMRALDYLQGRPDIDGERLGCTGYSGGCTLTSYLTALDSRISCSAPCCPGPGLSESALDGVRAVRQKIPTDSPPIPNVRFLLSFDSPRNHQMEAP